MEGRALESQQISGTGASLRCATKRTWLPRPVTSRFVWKVGLEVLRCCSLFFVFFLATLFKKKIPLLLFLASGGERTNEQTSISSCAITLFAWWGDNGGLWSGLHPFGHTSRAPCSVSLATQKILIFFLLLGEGVKRKNINRTKEWKFFSLWLDGRCLAQTATHASTARTHERGKSKLK